jgi:hypothetical protein
VLQRVHTSRGRQSHVATDQQFVIASQPRRVTQVCLWLRPNPCECRACFVKKFLTSWPQWLHDCDDDDDDDDDVPGSSEDSRSGGSSRALKRITNGIEALNQVGHHCHLNFLETPQHSVWRVGTHHRKAARFFTRRGTEDGGLHAVVVLEDVPGGLDGALEGGCVDN